MVSKEGPSNPADGQEGPGQVKVGGGSPLLLALTRDLDLLPDLHRDALLAVTELLVAVLPENHGHVIMFSLLMSR